MNSRFIYIHEIDLRSVYSDHVSSFDELLKKDLLFYIHPRNIQCLAIEPYKLWRFSFRIFKFQDYLQ